MDSQYAGSVEVTMDSNNIYRPRTRPRIQEEIQSLDQAVSEQTEDSKAFGPRVSWMKYEMSGFDVEWDETVSSNCFLVSLREYNPILVFVFFSCLRLPMRQNLVPNHSRVGIRKVRSKPCFSCSRC